MGFLLRRLVLVKPAPAALSLHVYLLHHQVAGWQVDMRLQGNFGCSEGDLGPRSMSVTPAVAVAHASEIE